MSGDLQAACKGYDPFDVFDEYFGQVAHAGFLDQCMFVDIKTWLQDDILVKADRMSMANSVEIRSPFLDHRLVEFTMPLAPAAKLDGRRSKVILRDVMRDHLPEKVFKRPKHGFGAPAAKVGDLSVTSGGGRNHFNPDFRLQPEAEDVTYKSFSLAILNEWLRRFEAAAPAPHDNA